MTARPILFSPGMVAAILDGRKSVTRRIMNPQPVQIDAAKGGKIWQCRTKVGFCNSDTDGTWPGWMTRHTKDQDGGILRSACPFGAAGDTLWIREEHYRYGHWEPVLGTRTKKGRQKWCFVADSGKVLYEAPAECRKGRHHKDPGTSAWHKRLARFMPRALSRLTLEVTGVAVERLQAITEEQARAEGVQPVPFCRAGRPPGMEHVEAFEDLWCSLHGPESWEANPWVWAISFTVDATSPALRR